MSNNDLAKKPRSKFLSFLRRSPRSPASSATSVKTADTSRNSDTRSSDTPGSDTRSLDRTLDSSIVHTFPLETSPIHDTSISSVLDESTINHPHEKHDKHDKYDKHDKHDEHDKHETKNKHETKDKHEKHENHDKLDKHERRPNHEKTEKLRRSNRMSSSFEDDSGPEYDLDDIMSDEPDYGDYSSSFAMLEVDEGRDLHSFFEDLPADALNSPKYTRVSRKSNKSPKALNQLFLCQELRCSPAYTEDSEPGSDHDDSTPGAQSQEILIMEFSRDGKYLAVAGRDSRITVWQVISSPLSRLKYKNYETAQNEAHGSRKSKSSLSAPVFLQEPVRVFEGHTKSILCLDWSKNNFLVSGSMDKTVKLWNIDRPRCLETFTHEDFVTAVRFHPNDDRFFMSTALDNQIRLWSIMESCVAYSNHLGDDFLATTMTFTPTAETCILGGFNGTLMAVETHGCHIKTSYNIKGKTRRGARDRKITGIQIYKTPGLGPTSGDFEGLSMLMSTTDNQISLIDISRGRLVTRFKGSSSKSSSMKASISEDQSLVICGSEDHWCYVWSNNNSIINNKLRSAMKEILRESKSQLTEKHKSLSRVLHDNKLWKKIPVQKFLENSNDQNYIANDNSSYAAFHAHHSRVNIALFAPQSTKKLLKFSDDVIFDLVKRGADISDSPHSHYDEEKQLDNGHIIVTCDSSGLIRVYRQDSAYYIRKNLIELKKVYKRELASSRSDSVNSNINNLKIDLTSLNTKIMKTRSMSPANENASLRSQFHHRLKSGHRNSLSTLKRNGSSNPVKMSATPQNRSPQPTERNSYFPTASRRPDIFNVHSTDSSDAEYSLPENASPLRLNEARGRNRRGSSLADSDYPNSILSPLIGSHLAMRSTDSLNSRI